MYRSSKELQKQDQNVEVLVHLSNKKGVCWGHVDIALGDTVYSFGNYDYDKKHRKFFGLVWEGVLFTCNREKYMNFSLNVLHNVIISYRLRLSDMEKATIREHLQTLKKNCHPWLPDQKSRYARALSRLGADLFKFNKGAFRTYFVFNANCAFLVETLLSGTRLPRLRSGKGLVSPGSLIISYELENMRKHGGIESRQIYAGSCLPPVLQL